MLRGLIVTFLLIITVIPVRAQGNYFPERTFGDEPAIHNSWATRYSKYLIALQEPSLSSRSKSGASESYRFLWLRTFHRPVSVRLDVGNDGVATVTTKMTSGVGGAGPGHLIESRTRRLTKKETDRFVNQVSESEFWKLPTHEDPVIGGPDGSQWVIEGTKNGKYHAVDRWSPKDGAVRILGLALAIDLGQLNLPAKEIY
jgi:hypothetical protein